ncbi:MAG: DUF2779 domain-containing protein [Bacteroidia bacterium]
MEINKHVLSKSTFMYGSQCTKRLFLHKFHNELRNPEEEVQQSIFSTGTDVGIIGRDLFPGGYNAEPPDSYSYHLSVEKTRNLIQAGAEIIYEAAFSFEGVMCAIDILVKHDDKWYAYEIKGTTKVKEQHIIDAALQHYVITQTGLPIEDFYISYLNNQYVLNDTLDVLSLFSKASVLKEVKEQEPLIISKIDELKTVIGLSEAPSIEAGDHCFSPYDCNFTNHCWAGIAADEAKSDREAFIDKPYLSQFVSELKYPLFFWDLETLMPAIPEFKWSRPYQQIPFQYSLHVIRSKEAELEHFEYLGDGFSDPREEMIKELINALGSEGSIIVWNQTFEISRLKEMARDFPKYKNELNAIIDRVVDLMIPFRKKMYYHPDFNESYSIKKVLPVLVPELNYNALTIQEGGTASVTYAELKNQTAEMQEEQRKHLLEYCKLDTLAMVEILKVIFNESVL